MDVAVVSVQERQARDLAERLAEAVSVYNLACAQLVTVTAEATTSDAWLGVGVRSVNHWLTWQAGVSPATARSLVRVAEAGATHPVLRGQFDRGELGLDQVAVAVQAPPSQDAAIAELAPYCMVSQIRTLVRAATPPPEPTEPDTPVESVTFGHGDNGRGYVRADLDADHYQIFDAALGAAKDRLYGDGHHDVTWVEALMDVCGRSLDGEDHPRQDRFRIALRLDPTEAVPARYDSGWCLPDAIRRYLTCDGWITPIFTDGAHPLSVGRGQRIVPDRTRREVLARDRHCRAPWCAATRHLHVHHLHHWEHGGATDLDNLIALCGSCHRRHHRGEYDITGDPNRPDGLTFRDRHGHPITTPPPRTPTAPPPKPARRYQHPHGERLDTALLHFPHPPPPRGDVRRN